jgi:hypothetical protein
VFGAGIAVIQIVRLTFIACALVALGCAEAKKQARLGLVGGSSYAGPANPQMPNVMPVHPDPVSAVGAAVGAAMVSKAVGGCLSQCPPGTACNQQTGLCETMPCRGMCRDDEVCESEKCVPALKPNLQIDTRITPQ